MSNFDTTLWKVANYIIKRREVPTSLGHGEYSVFEIVCDSYVYNFDFVALIVLSLCNLIWPWFEFENSF